jgi:hypothetical protein
VFSVRAAATATQPPTSAEAAAAEFAPRRVQLLGTRIRCVLWPGTGVFVGELPPAASTGGGGGGGGGGGAGGAGKQENFKEKLTQKELDKAQEKEERDADKYADVDPLPEPEVAEVTTKPPDVDADATGGRESFTGMGAAANGGANWLWNILFKGFWVFLIFLACVIAYEPRLRFYYSNLFGGGGGNGKSRMAEFFGRGKK